MKALERIVLRHLRPLVSPNMDPLQFAYQPSTGVDDAVIYLLQRSLSHLEDAGNTVRITFFDFSSAFNTIHPSLLRVKLERAGASDQLAAWVTNYLTDRPQFVRLQDCVSDVVVCSTEGNDCEYRKVIMDFVDWCELNHLQVNASKTKEMVIDFSRKPSADIAPLNIQGLDIERIPHDHDPYYCGRGEGTHQRQFISGDELLSWDETHGSYSRPLGCECAQTLAPPKPIPQMAYYNFLSSSPLPAGRRADRIRKGSLRQQCGPLSNTTERGRRTDKRELQKGLFPPGFSSRAWQRSEP
ncbi:hypothetical protein L3Q82_021415, partial [Scortum barcoo]